MSGHGLSRGAWGGGFGGVEEALCGDADGGDLYGSGEVAGAALGEAFFHGGEGDGGDGVDGGAAEGLAGVAVEA